MAVASKVETVNRYGIKCPAGVVAEPNNKTPDGTFGAWFTFTGSDLWHYVLTLGALPLCGDGRVGKPVRCARALAGGVKVYCPECKRLAAERWRFR